MQHPTKSRSGIAFDPSAATALFRQAAAETRDTLNHAELGLLLSSLGIGFSADAASAGRMSPDVALRISLTNTREFGMVISAGLGGLDAALADDHFRKGRAAVHAATELTDADDFLALFRRTFAYQKLAGIASARGAAALRTSTSRRVFAAHARAGKLLCSPDNPGAPFVLRSLELDPVARRRSAGSDGRALRVRRDRLSGPCPAPSTRSTSSSIPPRSASSASRPAA